MAVSDGHCGVASTAWADAHADASVLASLAEHTLSRLAGLADGMRWHSRTAKTGGARKPGGAGGTGGAGGARGARGARRAVPPALQPPTSARISMD